MDAAAALPNKPPDEAYLLFVERRVRTACFSPIKRKVTLRDRTTAEGSRGDGESYITYCISSTHGVGASGDRVVVVFGGGVVDRGGPGRNGLSSRLRRCERWRTVVFPCAAAAAKHVPDAKEWPIRGVAVYAGLLVFVASTTKSAKSPCAADPSWDYM